MRLFYRNSITLDRGEWDSHLNASWRDLDNSMWLNLRLCRMTHCKEVNMEQCRGRERGRPGRSGVGHAAAWKTRSAAFGGDLFYSGRGRRSQEFQPYPQCQVWGNGQGFAGGT